LANNNKTTHKLADLRKRRKRTDRTSKAAKEKKGYGGGSQDKEGQCGSEPEIQWLLGVTTALRGETLGISH
jgi:hypothetical protein